MVGNKEPGGETQLIDLSPWIEKYNQALGTDDRGKADRIIARITRKYGPLAALRLRDATAHRESESEQPPQSPEIER